VSKIKKFFIAQVEDYLSAQAQAEHQQAQEEAFYEHTILSIVDLMTVYGYNNVLSAINRRYDEVAKAMGILEEV
jgi:hypothetical protein